MMILSERKVLENRKVKNTFSQGMEQIITWYVPWKWQIVPVLSSPSPFNTSFITLRLASPTKVTARPPHPALAVRPTLCTYLRSRDAIEKKKRRGGEREGEDKLFLRDYSFILKEIKRSTVLNILGYWEYSIWCKERTCWHFGASPRSVRFARLVCQDLGQRHPCKPTGKGMYQKVW